MSRTLFISDLHLRGAGDGRTEPVLDFLATRGADADTIFLVGDVFDFWLGYRSVTLRSYFPILRRFADIVDSGKRLVLFSGNHDPDPGDFLSDLGVEVHEQALIEDIDGVTVRIEHGDTIDPRSFGKRAVCKAARARPLRFAARMVPPGITVGLANFYAQRVHSPGYHEPLPQALFTRYLPKVAAAGADVLVMGHYHRAVHHRAIHHGRLRQFYVLGDWIEHRTYLECVDGVFRLMRYCPGGPDLPVPEGDHPPAVT